MAERSYRVLLVDDEPLFIELAREKLIVDQHFQVVGTASSGEHALRSAKELRPDVVLVDAHMSGITGFETARRLRALLPDLRVVVLSADDEPGYGTLAHASGALGFLPKRHLTPRALLALLAEPATGP
jgi:DNA-binding NarL/FixJ family response regulator